MTEELNRVSEDLATWRNREERFEKLFPGTLSNNLPFLKEKLGYLDNLQAKYNRSANAEELLTLRILKQERKALAVRIYPNPLIRFVRNLFLPFRQKEIERLTYQQVDENVRSLKEVISKAGFNQLAAHLENQVKQGQKDFNLSQSYYVNEKERVEYNLSFTKDNSGNYQFEGYKAALYSENILSGMRQHNFQLEQGQIFTAEQAQHLLAGRALQNGQSWMQFDLNDKDAAGNFRMKYFPENYGYDVRQALERSGIKDLINDEALNQAIAALKTGNRYEVTVNVDGKEQKLFVEGNPQHKAVNILNANNKPYNIKTPASSQSQQAAQQNNLSQAKKNSRQAEKTKEGIQKKRTRRISLH